MNTTQVVLFVVGLAFLIADDIACRVAKRKRHRRDDLMALHDSLHVCGAVSRGYEPGHLWHDCKLRPDHERGRSTTSRDMGWCPDDLHQCRCGITWTTSAADREQIALLDRMLGAQAYEPDRRTR